MKRKIILLLSVFTLLAGCWDSNEPERLVYAHGIGVDYKDGEIILHLQILNMKGLAKSESGGDPGGTNPSDVGTARGKTIEEAIFNLYRSSDRRIYWGHLSFVLMSESAIKSGVFEYVVDFLDRYRETRYRIYFYMTKDPLDKAMLVAPIENVSLAFSRLSDPEGNYRQNSFISPINLREIIIELDEPSYYVLIPQLKVVKSWKKQKEKETELSVENAAVITNNDLEAILPKRVLQGGRLVNKNFVRDSVTLFEGTEKETSIVVFDKKYKIEPIIEKDGKPRFKVSMELKASIEVMNDQISRLEYEKELSRSIKKEIKYTYQYTQKRNIDLFRLSESLYRKKNSVWKKVEHNGSIPLEKDTLKSIKINVKLRDTGKNKLTPIFNEEKGDEKKEAP